MQLPLLHVCCFNLHPVLQHVDDVCLSVYCRECEESLIAGKNCCSPCLSECLCTKSCTVQHGLRVGKCFYEISFACEFQLRALSSMC